MSLLPAESPQSAPRIHDAGRYDRPMSPLAFQGRSYGDAGPVVILLHGGPGAPGHMAPVGRELGKSFRVLEPFQRRSGREPLTVGRHVLDLQALVEAQPERPAIVGSSWGAMLALAFSAARPDSAEPLVLVGGGTWDRDARERFREIVAERMTGDLRARFDALEDEIDDPDERLAARGELIGRIYHYDPLDLPDESVPADERGHRETWDDMIRCQERGLYPAAFARITSPVLMLHGAYDPHPGTMIRDSLLPHLPQLEYVEWEKCGHYPWMERHARDAFYETLTAWIRRHAEG